MISRRLRTAVQRAAVQQYRLAAAIGVTHGTLSAWMNGISRVRDGDPRIVQLGAILGVPERACFSRPRRRNESLQSLPSPVQTLAAIRRPARRAAATLPGRRARRPS